MKKTLIILALATVLTSCWDTKEAVFVLPQEFIGYVVVLHDQPEGVPSNFKDGQQIYNITHSGILKTQVESVEDWSAEPSFYWEEISPYNEIERVDVNELIDYKYQVYGYGHGNIFIEGRPEPIAYTQFFVSTSSEVDSLIVAFENLDLVALVHDN